jgi:hypothetical protein
MSVVFSEQPEQERTVTEKSRTRFASLHLLNKTFTWGGEGEGRGQGGEMTQTMYTHVNK